MKKTTTLLALLATIVLHAGFQCEERCIEMDVPLKTSGHQTVHLDHRGAAPLELNPGAQGWREAYGFRLSAFSELQNTADTVGIECPLYWPSPQVSGIEVLTLTPGLGALYPSGAVVSNLFKYETNNRYKDLSSAAVFLTQQWSGPGRTATDFWLLQPPPAPGWQQFEIRLQFSDTTSMSIVTDSIYLQ